MTAPITRRTFLWLSRLSGLTALGFGGSSWVLSPTQSDTQRTLEAVLKVLLPGDGAYGTAADEPSALDSQLYGKMIYAHLRDEYYSPSIDQAALDQAAHDLDRATRCLGLRTESFAELSEQKQLGLLALVTRREDEDEAPSLTSVEKACLRLGGAEGSAPQAIDLARFAGLIFYTSNPGLVWLRQSGYPGPNWGFNPANGWAQIERPPF